MNRHAITVLVVGENPGPTSLLQEGATGGRATSFVLKSARKLSEGLACLRAGGISAVLLDLGLPDSRGLDTLLKVRELAPDVPTVVLTSMDDEELGIQAVQRGAQDYLVKGHVDGPGIVRAIRYAIERHRLLTERQEAEEEAQKAHAQTEQLFSSITSILIGVSAEGLVTHWNGVAETTFGLAQADVLDHPLGACRVHWDTARVQEGLSACQRNAQTIRLDDVAFRCPDGKDGFLGITIIPIKGTPGKPAGALLFGADITERRQIQERERELTAATAAAEAEKKRAAELEKANQQLKRTQAMLIQAEKMAAVGQLSSGIAHEVKNPLDIILRGINYLEGEVDHGQAEVSDVLRMIKDAVKRSDTIIRGLLDFSKPAELTLKPCALEPVVDASLVLVEKQLAVKNIRVTKAFDADLPVVMLDDNQMQQVFINLFLNALHAMQDGGQLSIHSHTKKLTRSDVGVGQRTVGVCGPGTYALICDVTDTGGGIAADDLDKVFDPFFTTKAPGQGTGLGLAITRAIVERHRGLIHLESRQRQGTTVTITLPIAGAVSKKPRARRARR